MDSKLDSCCCRIVIVLLISLLVPAAALSQETEEKAGNWQNSLMLGLNFAQNTFSNWVEGGSSSLAWAWALSGEFDRKVERHSWENELGLEYGLIKQEGEELRKSIDRIEFETSYSRHLDFFVEPFAAASVKTQFAKGRDYKATPDTLASGDLEYPATSSFADPLYLVQSFGVGRHIDPYTRTRLGLAVQEVITSDFRRYACTKDEGDLYASDSERDTQCDRIKVETGLESVTSYKRAFQENTVFDSKLRFFYSFEQSDQLDMNWRNELNATILRYLKFHFAVEFLFDEDVLDELQVKQVLGLGFNFTLL